MIDRGRGLPGGAGARRPGHHVAPAGQAAAQVAGSTPVRGCRPGTSRRFLAARAGSRRTSTRWRAVPCQMFDVPGLYQSHPDHDAPVCRCRPGRSTVTVRCRNGAGESSRAVIFDHGSTRLDRRPACHVGRYCSSTTQPTHWRSRADVRSRANTVGRSDADRGRGSGRRRSGTWRPGTRRLSVSACGPNAPPVARRARRRSPRWAARARA